MNKEQYRAICDICKEEQYPSYDLLIRELKSWGVIDERTTIEDFEYLVDDDSYETMYKYIRELIDG